MEEGDVLILIISGSVVMAIAVIISFICCYKKLLAKFIHDSKKEKCDQKLPKFGAYLARKVSVQFNVPKLSGEGSLPFKIQEVKMTDNALPTIKEKRDRSPHIKRKITETREHKVSVYKTESVELNQQQSLSRRFACSTESHKKTGIIHFTAEYIMEEKKMQVFVDSVTEICVKNLTVEVYPFVALSLLSSSGRKRKKETSVQKTINPVFKEMIEFQDIERDTLRHHKLKFKVQSQSAAAASSRNKELLGQVDILLSSISFYGKEIFDIYLFKQKSTITMTSVSISMCHRATVAKLEIYLDKVKGLPRGSTGSSIYGAFTLSKPDNATVRRTTSFKHSSSDPVFEEMVTFENLYTNSADPFTSYSLLFTLIERSIMGNDQILGLVTFNLNSPQLSAAKQWTALETQPHTNHSWWHYLVGPDDVLP